MYNTALGTTQEQRQERSLLFWRICILKRENVTDREGNRCIFAPSPVPSDPCPYHSPLFESASPSSISPPLGILNPLTSHSPVSVSFRISTTGQRSASTSLQDASVKAIPRARVLLFWSWISRTDRLYRHKSCLSTSSSFCSLPLAFPLQRAAGGSYALVRVCPMLVTGQIFPVDSWAICFHVFTIFSLFLLTPITHFYHLPLLDWCYYIKKERGMCKHEDVGIDGYSFHVLRDDWEIFYICQWKPKAQSCIFHWCRITGGAGVFVYWHYTSSTVISFRFYFGGLGSCYRSHVRVSKMKNNSGYCI